jgi:alkylation response protein AidB-like acyl-CoA dehydrogenase
LTTIAPSLLEWVNPDQAAMYEEVLAFALSLPRDRARALDGVSGFDRESWSRCGSFGVMGMPAPIEYGGLESDVVTTILALEALGFGCTDNGLVFSVNAHMWTSVVPIWQFGTQEQKRTWLPGLCSGELIGCHAMTEPGAGSDPFSLIATAHRTDDGYVLNGRKTFITNAPVADLVIVFARTAEPLGPYGITAFIVPAGTPGMDVSGEIEKMGLRTSPMSEVVLEDCVVPESSVLGRVGRGGEVFHRSME